MGKAQPATHVGINGRLYIDLDAYLNTESHPARPVHVLRQEDERREAARNRFHLNR